MEINNTEEMYKVIRNWEIDNGESFMDYFDSSLSIPSFMFWALGKGYLSTEKFDKWHDAFIQPYYCEVDDFLFGQEEYSIIRDDEFEVGEEWEANYDTAMHIFAEFLNSTEVYKQRVLEFLEDNQ